jgi:hypothetical protein
VIDLAVKTDLAELYDRYRAFCHQLNDDDVIEFDAAVEQFAELIVIECANVYSAIDNGNKVMGTDNYLEALRKHFGVKE